MNGNRVVATTSHAAFAVGARGRITAWNERAEQRLGYRRSEVIGRCCWKVLQGEDLSIDRKCASTCPYLELQREPVDRAQQFLRPIDRTLMAFRGASDEATRGRMSTFVVGAAGGRQIVHML